MRISRDEICELAHDLTVTRCKELNIPHSYYDHVEDEELYTTKGQEIFNTMQDNIEAILENNPPSGNGNIRWFLAGVAITALMIIYTIAWTN